MKTKIKITTFRIVTLLLITVFNGVYFAAAADAPVAPVIVGTAISVQGTVTVKHIDKEQPDTLKARSRLYVKDVIETGAGSKVKILFQDESLMNISENSRVEVVEQTRNEQTKTNKSVYQLVTGKIRVLAGKISGEKSEYEVKTPTALAAVRGTQFFVWVETPKISKVFVVEGEVEVENIEIPGVKVSVSENFWTLVEAGLAPVQPSPINLEDLNKLFRDTNISADNTISQRARSAFRGAGGEAEGGGETAGTGEQGGEGTEGQVDIVGTGTGDTDSTSGTDLPPNDTTPPSDTNGGGTTGDTGVTNTPGGEGTGGTDVTNDVLKNTLTTPGEGSTGGQSGPVIPPQDDNKGKIIIKF